MEKNGTVSIREVYQLVDTKVEKVNQSLLRLEGKFDSLESGRLSTLEANVANMQGKLMMIPILISIGFNIFFFVVDYILKVK